MDIQQIIKEIRSAGYTQDEVAKAVGLTQGTVSAIERGAVKRTFAIVAILRLHKKALRKLGKVVS